MSRKKCQWPDKKKCNKYAESGRLSCREHQCCTKTCAENRFPGDACCPDCKQLIVINLEVACVINGTSTTTNHLAKVPQGMRMMIYKLYLKNRWYSQEKKEYLEDTELNIIDLTTQLLSKTDTVTSLEQPEQSKLK